uniref:Uncharacterized protein n=1 Tax=Plectus sambesii TaxID=2011161 RepID=A0A914VAU5_9BILA
MTASRLTFCPRALRHAMDPRRPAVRGGAAAAEERPLWPWRLAIARLLSGAVTTFCPPSASAIRERLVIFSVCASFLSPTAAPLGSDQCASVSRPVAMA